MSHQRDANSSLITNNENPWEIDSREKIKKNALSVCMLHHNLSKNISLIQAR